MRAHRTRSAAAVAGCAALVAAAWLGAERLSRLTPLAAARSALSGHALFDPSRIWTVHLRFSAAQWAALEPAPSGLGGRQRGPGGGPGFPGPPEGFGPPGGPGGPAGFIAAGWLREGDANGDGLLSRDEFTRLTDGWFATWDATAEGRLTAETLSSGLRSVVMPDGEGPRGRGGPPGPGGPDFVGQDGGRNGMAAAMGLDFQWVTADLEFEGQVFPNVAVRYKGNNTFMESQGTLKRSMKIDLNRHVGGRKLGGVSTVNLHNNITDAELDERAAVVPPLPRRRRAGAPHLLRPGLRDG